MHPNPVYRGDDLARNLNFVRERAFGVLTVSGEAGPVAAHLPFVLSGDGKRLEAHVMRSNPVWRAIETPQKALLIVSGPDAYISPDWYGVEDTVPTRNYVAVHLRGRLVRRDPGEIEGFVERLSDAMEKRLLPKPVWKLSKVSPDVLARFYRIIVPVELEIESVEATWKLNQNKPREQALAAADALAADGFGMEVAALVALMRAESGEK